MKKLHPLVASKKIAELQQKGQFDAMLNKYFGTLDICYNPTSSLKAGATKGAKFEAEKSPPASAAAGSSKATSIKKQIQDMMYILFPLENF